MYLFMSTRHLAAADIRKSSAKEPPLVNVLFVEESKKKKKKKSLATVNECTLGLAGHLCVEVFPSRCYVVS